MGASAARMSAASIYRLYPFVSHASASHPMPIYLLQLRPCCEGPCTGRGISPSHGDSPILPAPPTQHRSGVSYRECD